MLPSTTARIYAAESLIAFTQPTVSLCFSFIEQTLRLLVPELVVRVSQNAFKYFVRFRTELNVRMHVIDLLDGVDKTDDETKTEGDRYVPADGVLFVEFMLRQTEVKLQPLEQTESNETSANRTPCDQEPGKIAF